MLQKDHIQPTYWLPRPRIYQTWHKGFTGQICETGLEQLHKFGCIAMPLLHVIVKLICTVPDITLFTN